MRELRSPGVSADDVVPLLREAVNLLGEQYAKLHADRCRQGRPRAEWHPWAPGFAWLFDLDPRQTSVDISPPALLVARDVRFLHEISSVWNTPELRKIAARLVRDQREAALQELRSAGYYAAVGIRAEWTAVTGTDPADVLLPDLRVALQMKTRDAEETPMADETRVLNILADARVQLKGDRPGAVVMTIPGVTDWRPFARRDSVSQFYERLTGRFVEPRWSVVSAVIMMGDPIVTRRPYGAHMTVPSWIITNERASYRLPEAFRLWVDDS